MLNALHISQAWASALYVLAGLAAIAVLFAVGRIRRPRRPARARGPVLTDEEALRQDLAELGRRLDTLEESVANMVEALPRSVQGVGVVRYNPFPDTGGNMSFSLALLDGRANGVVMSVLTSRDGSRVYGKPVEGGSSTYPLSDEERKALALAKQNRG